MVIPACKFYFYMMFHQKCGGELLRRGVELGFRRPVLHHVGGRTLASCGARSCTTCVPVAVGLGARVPSLPLVTNVFDCRNGKSLAYHSVIPSTISPQNTRAINSVAFSVSQKTPFQREGIAVDSSSLLRAEAQQSRECSGISLDVGGDMPLAYGSYSQELLDYIKDAVSNYVRVSISHDVG